MKKMCDALNRLMVGAAVVAMAAGTVMSSVAAANVELPKKNDAAVQEVLAGDRTEANVAWWGFDEADSTAAFQAAIDSGARVVRVPDMGKPWVVGPLKLAGDQQILFGKGAVLEAKRGLFKDKNESLLTASHVKNVSLIGYGATIRMHREDYLDATQYEPSEWRHTLSIRSSENVEVIGLTFRDSGGDAIYIGQQADANGRMAFGPVFHCSNIVIRDVVADRHHRQGLSVISVDNLLVERSVFTNTTGTAPAAGIDFEPNHPKQRLSNIVVRQCYFQDNKRGVMGYFKKLNRSSEPLSILVEDCRVVGGVVGIDISYIADAGPSGEVMFRDCFVENTFVRVRDKSVDGAKVTFDRCVINNEDGKVPAITMHTIYDGTKRHGGIEFRDVRVTDRQDRPFLLVTRHHPDTRVIGLSGQITAQNPAGLKVTSELPMEEISLTVNGKPLDSFLIPIEQTTVQRNAQ